jgi:uncharacterized membrane protein YhaH (DUF805 family)
MLKLVPMPIRQYAKFNGRMTRNRFLRWLVFLGLVYVLCAWVDLAVIAPALGYLPYEEVEERYLTMIAGIIFILPWFSSSVRRLHDVNRSGWWMLLAIPMGLIFYFSANIGFAAYGFLADPSVSGWVPQNIVEFAINRMSWFATVLAMLSYSPVIYWSLKKGRNEKNRFGLRD